MAGKSAKLQRIRSKSVGRAPTWLKTVAIAKPHGPKPHRGSFGAASPCVTIDPKTGLPREEKA